MDASDTGLGARFFLLGDIVTSDLVYEECLAEAGSRELVESAQTLGHLRRLPLDEGQLSRTLALAGQPNGLSVPDASVYTLAQEEPGILLSSDRPLVTYAREHGVRAHGLLYVLETLLAMGHLDRVTACTCLRTWAATNDRAPVRLIDEYLSRWEG